MRRADSARYARWSAAVAIAIALAVAAVYLKRRWGEAAARRLAPPPVSAAVEEQSAQFSFSKAVKNRTVFTVRASQATKFKDGNRSLLENVSITIYGLQGERNDTLRAQKCSYEPSTGQIRCQGKVQIDLQDAAVGKPERTTGVLHLETSDVSFDSDTGDVTADAPVAFRFAEGQGRATGIAYNTRNTTVTLEKDVRLELAAAMARSVPIVLQGSRMVYSRKEQSLRLYGPVHVQQGELNLTAGRLLLKLDPEMHPQSALVSEGPRLTSAKARGKIVIAAGSFRALFNPAGWLEQFGAEGGVQGEQQAAAGDDRLTARQVELEMKPSAQSIEPEKMMAQGNVIVETRAKGSSSRLDTDDLRVTFRPAARGRGIQMENAETLAPGVMETTQPGESIRVGAGTFKAEFGSYNRIEELNGARGVEIRRQASGLPLTVTGKELKAAFGSGNALSTFVVNGDVSFRQGDRWGKAGRAQIIRRTNQILLAGSPIVGDASTQTTAGRIEINQQSGEVRATGGVLTSYLGTGRAGTVNFGGDAAHIFADSLSSSSAKGLAVYTGHARLWQNDSVVQARMIELWRDRQILEARGNVVAVFPQSPGSLAKAGPPVLWQIRGPALEYASEPGRLDLKGGVQAQSEQGTISAQSLQLFLSPGPQGRRELTRAVADGSVEVLQGGRRGTAAHGEYTANPGKFVLSGGQPALTDASGNTTTGRELTFFLANDTILVNSRNGSRTITKHRVEK